MKAYKRYLAEISRPDSHYKKEFYQLEKIRQWLLFQNKDDKHMHSAAEHIELAQNEMLKSGKK